MNNKMPVRGGDSLPRTGTTIATKPILHVDAVSKSFGGAPALIDASLTLHTGVIFGIVGENGAGKSTLMKILAGIHPHGSYSGRFTFQGEECVFSDVHDARAAGIVMIPQELHVASGLSIAENMFAGDLPRRFGFVDYAALRSKAKRWLDFFGLSIEPEDPASELAHSEQRLALMAGSLSRNAQTLILDEPTASLSDGEAQSLFAHLERLKEKGIGVIFISHRLDDIEQVCDELVVMRNGKTVANFERGGYTRREVVTAMIGRDPGASDLERQRPLNSEVALSVRNLVVADPVERHRRRVNDVTLEVRRGEILGLFGLVGAGRTELARALYGTWTGEVTGHIEVAGKHFVPKSPRRSVQAGVAFLTEDRKQTGIFAGHSVRANLGAASSADVSRFGFFNYHADVARARKYIKQFDIRVKSEHQHIETLSGGNQQKVLLARWFATDPKVLILDEPTAGVDVGAREEIYLRIEELADAGCAVLLISSDLDEVVRMCDRTHVIYRGEIAATLGRRPSRVDLLAAATGGR